MLQNRRSGARTVMPYALSTLAAATLFLAAGPVNAATNYTASVSVSSSQTCTLTVSPPTYTAFTAKWTKSSASATTLTPTNSSTPAYIKFSYGTADCGRPDTDITTEAGGGAVVDPDTGVIAARAAAGDGAFWRFARVLAAAKMYANPNYTSQSPYASVDVPGMTETAAFTGPGDRHSWETLCAGGLCRVGADEEGGMEGWMVFGLDVEGHA